VCVAAIAFNLVPDLPFVLVHNRDEHFNRPSRPLSLSAKGVAGGVDERAGGMWLGVRENRFAFVTNFRRVPPVKGQSFRSRGEIVKHFLESETTPEAFLNSLEAHRYPAFTAVMGTLQNFIAYESANAETLEADSGVHGFSNGPLKPDWPKTARVKRGLRGMLLSGLREEKLVKSLMDLLSDTQPAPPEELPQTGLSPDRELALSSIFVRTPDYGTVASTVIWQDATGVKMWERTVDARGRFTLRNLNL